MQYGILRHRDRLFVIPQGLTLIGRHVDCSFILDHPSVSRQHALIHGEDGSFTIMDYKSANGILVNGRQIFRRLLRPGDEVILGEVACEFSIETDLEGGWRDHFENLEDAFSASPYMKTLQRGTRMGLVRDRGRYQFLLDAARELVGARSPREVGIRALHAALTGLECSRGFVALPSDFGRTQILNTIGISPERIERIPFYLAMAERARHARVVLRTTAAFPEYVHHDPRIVMEDIGSAIALPLPGAREVVGALYVDRLMVEPPLEKAVEEPLAVLAHGVGLALEASLWRTEIEESLGAVEFLGTGSGTIGIICGVCGEQALGGEQDVVLCETCNAIHHRDCWEYNEGCARFACGGNKHESLRMIVPAR